MPTYVEQLDSIAKALERIASQLERDAVGKSEAMKCSKCGGNGTVMGPSDSGYRECPACDGKGF